VWEQGQARLLQCVGVVRRLMNLQRQEDIFPLQMSLDVAGACYLQSSRTLAPVNSIVGGSEE
jgi:hypothetical protein